MITENYVSFETAKLLKEKGFNEKCEVWYAEYTSVWGGDSSGDRKYINIQFDDKNRFDEDYKFLCYAPTLQIAMKWLREEKHYYIQVMLDSWACGGHLGYYVVIQRTDSDFEMMLQEVREKVFYDTPEEAAEDAIMYIVENLI